MDGGYGTSNSRGGRQQVVLGVGKMRMNEAGSRRVTRGDHNFMYILSL